MFYVKEVTCTGPNSKLFRQVARESCGETYSPAEGNRVLFAYERQQRGNDKLVGVACYRRALKAVSEPCGTTFLADYYHALHYLFVKPYYKGRGVGSLLLQRAVKDMKQYAVRPVRVESAEKAVRFFQKHGFHVVGEPISCVCGGSPLFTVLCNMENT